MMRMVFVDSAGLSDSASEPVVTVAGVVTNADTTWKALEFKLIELGQKYAPDEVDLDGFCFQASDLFSGGKFFPKGKYPRAKRWALLEELCRLPADFDLALTCGYERPARYTEQHGNEDWLWALGYGYHTVLQVTQDWLRRNTPQEEIGNVVVEDSARAKQMLRFVQNIEEYRNGSENRNAHEREKHLLTRLIRDPSFRQKSCRSPLQLAEIYAFVAKRHLMGKSDTHHFWAILSPQIVNRVKPEYL